MTAPGLDPFVCPTCGSAEVTYEERVICDRRVRGVRAGVLVVEGLAEVDWESGDETTARLFCKSCLASTGLEDAGFGGEGEIDFV